MKTHKKTMINFKTLTTEQYEQAHKYIYDHWVNGDEGWSDLGVADQSGDTELLAHMICNTGAIDSTRCYEYAKGTEQIIEALARKFRKLSDKDQSKRYRQAFKACITISCDECNLVSFVHSGNETLYPELLKECWECSSTKIKVNKGLK